MKKIKLLLNILSGLAIVLIVVFILANYMLKKLYPRKYYEYVEKYSYEYDVEKELVYAVIKQESNFDLKAFSSKGAVGLMQITKETAREIGQKLKMEIIDLNDAETNIKIGTKYISDLMDKYNQNTGLTIAAYNAGMGNVDSWIDSGKINQEGDNLENIPFKETNMYVRKVLNTYKLYKKIY